MAQATGSSSKPETLGYTVTSGNTGSYTLKILSKDHSASFTGSAAYQTPAHASMTLRMKNPSGTTVASVTGTTASWQLPNQSGRAIDLESVVFVSTHGREMSTTKQIECVRVMWDYLAFPLWSCQVDGVCHQLDTGRLSLSEHLRRDLSAWSSVWDIVMSGSDEGDWNPPAPEREREWINEGRDLARRVKNELGSSIAVEYFNERTGELERI